jgi:hypothetical protein
MGTKAELVLRRKSRTPCQFQRKLSQKNPLFTRRVRVIQGALEWVAEARGNRTHRPTFGRPTGFEDRESHQTQSASVAEESSESVAVTPPFRKCLDSGGAAVPGTAFAKNHAGGVRQ